MLSNHVRLMVTVLDSAGIEHFQHDRKIFGQPRFRLSVECQQNRAGVVNI